MTIEMQHRYGRLSRYLHWGMAAVLVLQFITASVHAMLPDTALDERLWTTHKPMGVLLLLLVVLRIVWALIDRANRPPVLNHAAQLGHLALYGLMVAVPALALLRQYGSGREFSPLGLPLMSGFDEADEITWMTEAGSLLHGELGWALLALIAGHIVMAFWHRHRAGEDVLKRMIVR